MYWENSNFKNGAAQVQECSFVTVKADRTSPLGAELEPCQVEGVPE
jgi:hypothetical protein